MYRELWISPFKNFTYWIIFISIVGKNLLHFQFDIDETWVVMHFFLGVPGRQLQGEVRCYAPGQINIVLPLFLRQTDIFGPPVSDAGLHGLFSSNSQLLSG